MLVFKVIAVAAVLRGELVVPDRRRWSDRCTAPSGAGGDSPFLEECFASGRVPTVDELCRAALQRSDNTAGDALLPLTGGPAGLTRAPRRHGDDVTSLNRWSPG